MKKFFSTLQDIWKIEELKNKIIVTLSLMVVYRLAAHLPLPGIDPTQLTAINDKTWVVYWACSMLYRWCIFQCIGYGPGDHALYFCIYCCTINGNCHSLSAKIAKRR